MTHHIDNALLMHGEEPEIPYPALKSIVNDALKPDCDDRDFYVNQCRAYESRLDWKVCD